MGVEEWRYQAGQTHEIVVLGNFRPNATYNVAASEVNTSAADFDWGEVIDIRKGTPPTQKLIVEVQLAETLAAGKSPITDLSDLNITIVYEDQGSGQQTQSMNLSNIEYAS
jgi:hypothetical protein